MHLSVKFCHLSVEKVRFHQPSATCFKMKAIQHKINKKKFDYPSIKLKNNISASVRVI